MARPARVVAQGHPHQVMQRENHKRKVFFCDSIYEAYLELFAEVGLKRAEARRRACRTGRPLRPGVSVAPWRRVGKEPRETEAGAHKFAGDELSIVSPDIAMGSVPLPAIGDCMSAGRTLQ